MIRQISADTHVQAKVPRRAGLLGTALLAFALLLTVPRLATAQVSAARPRIVAQIDEGRLTTLHGNTHPLARPQFDQGAVADSQPVRRMLMLLQRSPEQEAALKRLVDQQQSSASPNYHQWLTPQQFGRQFGPADADVQAVTGWLQSHGFQVNRVSTGRTLIEFTGSAGQVRNAFHTEIHRYLVNGEEHLANASDPQIPAALAPVVAGTVSLHNFPKKPLSHKLGVFRKNKSSGQTTPLFTFQGTGCTAGVTNGNCNALGPGDFATIYNVLPLWTAGTDGTGQTIAIVGDSEICTANSPDFAADCVSDDVATFRSIFGLPFGLPQNSPNVILDGPDPGFNGDEIEGNLDVQWSGAVAKNATIDFVIAETTEATAGIDLAAEYIVDNNLAPVMSESFGACESGLGPAANQFYATLWEQAAAQGMTVVVSTGDSGSAGCDDSNTQNVASAFGPAVNGIASTPFNVAAGGTDFDITAASYQTTYWGANNPIGSLNDVSATKYIPETPWNDSCAQNFTGATTGCNPPQNLISENIIGGGGGESNCAGLDIANNCIGYTKPSWQTVASGSGLNAGNDLSRDLPDVALFAADGLVSNSFYAICDANFSTGPCSATPGFVDIIGVGGTSSSAPTFAGIMALVNQKVGARLGNANYVLYNLAATQTKSGLGCSSSAAGGPNSGCTFNDIVKGNNSVPCAGGSPGCIPITSAGSTGSLETINPAGSVTGALAFNAGTGLDLATGLGSVNATNLVNNWATAVGKFTATTTTLCLSTTATTNAACVPGPIAITHGNTVFVYASVTPIPSSGTISEDVSLIGTNGSTAAVDHFTSNNYFISNADIYPLTSGTVSGLTTTGLVGGNYSVIAHYAGDGTFGASDSTSPISVTVNPEAATATLLVGTINPVTQNVSQLASVPYGDLNLIRVDVIGASSGQETATGSVNIIDNGVAIVDPTGAPAPSFNLNTEGYLEDQTAFLAVGNHSFEAKYNGDASYAATAFTTATPTFTVVAAPTTTTLTTSVSNATATLVAVVDTQSANNPSGGSLGLPPSGSVQFMSGGNLLGTVLANNFTVGSDSNGFVAVFATLDIPIPSPAEQVTASYVPGADVNYLGSPSSAVSVGPGFNLSSSNAGTISIPARGMSGNLTVTATASSTYSGTVTLTVASVSPSNLSNTPSCSFGATGTIMLNATANPPVMSGAGTLTCNTTAPSAVYVPATNPRGTNWFLLAEAGAAIAFIFLLGISAQRRRSLLTFAALLFVVVLAGAGCGGSSSGGGGGGGNVPGTTVASYIVTVNATPSSGTTQITTVTLNVN